MRYTDSSEKVHPDQRRRPPYLPLRYILAILLTVLELLLIIGSVAVLAYFLPPVTAVSFSAQLFCVVRIIASDDNPDYKVPWLLVVLTVPVAGFLLYALFYSRKLTRKQKRKLSKLTALHYKAGTTRRLPL